MMKHSVRILSRRHRGSVLTAPAAVSRRSFYRPPHWRCQPDVFAATSTASLSPYSPPSIPSFQVVPHTCRSFGSKKHLTRKGPSSTDHSSVKQKSSSRPPKRRQQDNPQKNSAVLNNYIKRRDHLQPYEVALVWNKLGKSVQKSPKWERKTFWSDNKSQLRTLADHTVKLVDSFDARSTATVTHSLAKLLYLTDAKLGQDQSLWNALLVRTIVLIKSDAFDGHSLSNLLWAYAKTDDAKVDGRLLDSLEQAATRRVDEFIPQGLSNVSWAFAKLDHQAPLLFDAIAIAAPARLDSFKPQDISNTAWAFATLNHEVPLLFDAIAKVSSERLDKFNAQDISNTAWAFATLNHEAPLLFDAIASVAPERLDNFCTPQNLANAAWAFATLNHKAPLLFDAIAKSAHVRIEDFNPQDLSNTAWAFAVLDVNNDLLTDSGSAFTNALVSAGLNASGIEELHQLHQYHLWCQEHNAADWFPVELSSRCSESFLSQEARFSRLQKDVAASLRTLQEVKHVEAKVLTDIGYRLDAVVVYRGGIRIGVEVDGPSHFVGRSQKLSGTKFLKHRQLRTLEGWKLVSIPYWEWNKINSGSDRKAKKQKYLQNLLNQAVEQGL